MYSGRDPLTPSVQDTGPDDTSGEFPFLSFTNAESRLLKAH